MTASRWKVAFGIALVTWALLPVPGIVAYFLDWSDLAVWWITLVSPTLIDGGKSPVSPLIWMWFCFPVGTLTGAGLIREGLRKN